MSTGLLFYFVETFYFEAYLTFCQVGPRAVDLLFSTGRSCTAVYPAFSRPASAARDYSQKGCRTAPTEQAAVLHSEIYTCRASCSYEFRSRNSGVHPF